MRLLQAFVGVIFAGTGTVILVIITILERVFHSLRSADTSDTILCSFSAGEGIIDRSDLRWIKCAYGEAKRLVDKVCGLRC